MRYRILMFGFLFFSSAMGASWFAQDRAALKAQKGDWAGAKAQLTHVLVDASDDPVMLYDAGVASYKTGDLSQATAYFKRASSCALCLPALKEQAHFNWGNTCVQRKELERAIEQYETVLKLNAKNEPARHNLEVVKKMLEFQKQQSPDNKQDKKEQNKQDQKDNKSGQNDKQQQDKQQKQGTQEQKSSGEQQKDEQGSREQQKEQEKGRESQDQQQKQDKQNTANDKQQQKDEQQKREQQGPQNQDNQDGSQREQSAKHDKNEQEEREQKQKSAARAGQESQEQGAHEQASAGEQGESEKKLTSWMAQLLKEQEGRDAQVNKRLIQAQVSKKMSGQDGQNCW